MDSLFDDDPFDVSGRLTSFKQREEEGRKKLEMLEEKVATLERIITQLAHWTKFDMRFLKIAGLDVTNFVANLPPEDAEDVQAKKELEEDDSHTESKEATVNESLSVSQAKGLKSKSKSKKSTTKCKAEILEETKSRQSKSLKSSSVVAKKSTGGISRAGRPRRPNKKYTETSEGQTETPFKLLLVKPEPEDESGKEEGDDEDSYERMDEDDWMDSDFNSSDDDDVTSASDTDIKLQPDGHSLKGSENEGSPTKHNPFIKVRKLDKKTLKSFNVTLPQKETKLKRKRGRVNKGPYQCPKCPSIFRTKGEWKNHIRAEHPQQRQYKGPYACFKCSLVLRTSVELRKHLSTHKPGKKIYICETCGKTTDHKQKYFDHLRVHTGERPYICEVCGFGCKSTSQLADHLKMHKDERPHPCPQCDKWFRRKPEVKTHVRKMHSDDTSYRRQCHLCNLVVKDAFKLKRHIEEIHENTRKLICDICGQAFKRPHHLKKHVERHENPNRRKRGPQKPMIKTAFLLAKSGLEDESNSKSNECSNESGMDVVSGSEDANVNADEPSINEGEEGKEKIALEAQEQSGEIEEYIVPPELIISHVDPNSIRIHSARSEQRAETGTSGDYVTIDSSVVKEFQISFLQE